MQPIRGDGIVIPRGSDNDLSAPETLGFADDLDRSGSDLHRDVHSVKLAGRPG